MQQQAQRGAVTLMAAGFLLLAVSCLVLVVDTGRIYLEKRKLQQVADVSAIEAVARSGDCTSPGALATTYATQAAVRNGYVADADHTLAADCGAISSAGGERVFTVQSGSKQAIRVQVSHRIPASLIAGGMFGNTILMHATAVAAKGVPLAALTLRTTLASVDSTQSPILNSVLGGLLGGSALSLDVIGWNGLLNTQLNLFGYLDRFKSTLGLSAGGYDQVLATNVTLTQIADVAITALQQGGGTGDVNAAIAGLNLLKLGLGPVQVKLGDLLKVQTGTENAGVDTSMNLFQLVQGSIMLANGNSAVAADIPVAVPGVGTVTVATKVIQAPQLSAVGNPELAMAEEPNYVDPNYVGPNRIYVRSSQIRLYVGLSLGTLIAVSNNVLNGVLSLASPVTSFLNSALSLSIVEGIANLINSLACGGIFPACNSSEVMYVKALGDNVRVDMALQLGSGDGRVSAYSCGPAADSKTLTVKARTSIADVRVGRIGTDTNSNGTIETSESRAAVFSDSAMPTAAAIPLLEFGHQRSRYSSCTLALICINPVWYKSSNNSWVSDRTTATYYPEAGLALRVGSGSSGLGLTSSSLLYSAPAASALPEIGQPPAYKSLAASPSLLSTVSGLLNDITLEAYGSQTSGVVGSTIVTAVNLLDSTKDALQTVLGNLLAPVLDPVFNLLLNTLGLDLGKTEIGANLSCTSSQGVVLVQ